MGLEFGFDENWALNYVFVCLVQLKYSKIIHETHQKTFCLLILVAKSS
jgi:hypothetical protein